MSYQQTPYDTLQLAKAAIKQNDRKTAYRLLAEVINQNPRGKEAEAAWLWMGKIVNDVRHKQQCYETALDINPHNKTAQQLLIALTGESITLPTKTATRAKSVKRPFNFPFRAVFKWLLILGSVAGGVTAVVFFGPILGELLLDLWESLQVFFAWIVFVFFFPLSFPLLMIIIGGISMIVAPFLAWMVDVGMYLLTQMWWWFPGGWIMGTIVAVILASS
jgi:hypothetical protein